MERLAIGANGDIPEGALHRISTSGYDLVLTRINGRICAFENRCPHLDLELDNGTLVGNTLVCLWHAARFELPSGENLRWAANEPNPDDPGLPASQRALTIYPVIEEDGEIFIVLGDS